MGSGDGAAAPAGQAESASLLDTRPVELASSDHRLAFHTVAIGASAGGVEALQRLFAVAPRSGACAYVVVMHLAPTHKSQLVQLIARASTMPVHQAEHDMPVQVDHVYIIAPAQTLEIRAGRLHVQPMSERHVRPLAVDRFMTSLALDQGERAIGVILSGTDDDGALGVKSIKSEGGLTIAQLPSSAAHAGMPSSAVATGAIDQELTIEDIPGAIAAFVKHAGLAAAEPSPPPPDLGVVLDVIRRQAELDFSGYKEQMLHRRLRRRMGLARTPTMADYIERLRASKAESRALAGDFLIGVTEFFREPGAWQALADDVLPGLLATKQAGDVVRAWVPGCATGEEAYSLAMTLLEDERVDERGLELQVFATDVDAAALDVARKGRYPKAIESAVSRERLRRFFIASDHEYRVRKELRDVVTFAPQNLAHDPPFSRMDLISCRNLLIYLQPDLQRRVLQLFQFALVPGGILALGKSETVGPLAGAFDAVSQSARIFRRSGAPAGAAVPPLRQIGRSGAGAAVGAAARPPGSPDYSRAVRDALLEQRPTTAVLTNRDGQALYFHGPSRKYIAHPEGMPTNDLFAMIDPALRPQLRAAIHMALTDERPVVTTAGVTTDEGGQSVRIAASRVSHPQADDLLLVSFEDLSPPGAAAPAGALDGDAHALRSLEEELRGTKRELRAAIEELEAANEELKVANEEAMATNEELQSTNEELETSQEELQSVNEELTTVNQQLELKLDELEQVNDDLSNLLASTSIPTLFLDRQLHIKRFTPAATRVFSLIASDLNRPLTDISGSDDTAAVVQDAREVLETLAPVVRETRSSDDRYYLRRTLPYRTQEDRIDGVVITFTDITDLKSAAEGLRRYAAVMHGTGDAVLVQDADGRLLAWNEGARALYGYSEAEALTMNTADLLPAAALDAYRAQVARALRGEAVQGWELQRRHRDGSLVEVAATLALLRDDAGRPQAVSLIERDITPQKLAQAQLRESEQRFRSLADTVPALIWMADPGGTLVFANRELAQFVGRSAQDLLRRSVLDWLHPDDRRTLADRLASLTHERARFDASVRLKAADGAWRWMKCSVMRQAEPALPSPSVVATMVDIDAQVHAEETLLEASRRKDEFLAMLGHELRNPLAPIRNAAEVLHHVADTDPRIGWVHGVLVRQVNHVTRLVDDLLDISLITRGALRLRLEPLDLAEVLARAIEEVQPLLESKRHAFETSLPEHPLWVEGDPIRLKQLFENLLTNAAKYTDDGGRIELLAEVKGDRVAVRVRDNGLGLSPEMLARVFDLFVQDPRAIDRSRGGLGIGLALVKHLATMHGGCVVARSAGIGRGCEFEVLLGRLVPTAMRRAAAAASPEPAHGGRVLLVDDDRESVESLCMLLALFGYQVKAAFDLDSALAAAAELQPQVLVTDIAMPGVSGFEVAARLRAMPGFGPGLKVIGMSGFGQERDFDRSKRERFDHYFVKPVDPDQLDGALKRLVETA